MENIGTNTVQNTFLNESKRTNCQLKRRGILFTDWSTQGQRSI